MKHILVSIKDSASQAFDIVQTVRAIGEALRNFQDAINDPNNRALHKHASDFELYHVGEFDTDTGRITPMEPALIARGADVQMQQGISITAR